MLQSMHSERGCYFISGLLLLLYIFIMDIILYCSLENTTLIDQKHEGSYSPFHPLSTKLLMSDPIQHYIINPTSEFFDEITKFSKIFYFISPNMISFTHLSMSLIAAKFVSSDNLKTRRLGVLLYQFRTWLDSLDGVVFRSHKNQQHEYKSHHDSWGFFIDAGSDITGAVIFSFGVLFYLFKLPASFFNKYKEDGTATLPLTKSENGYSSGEKTNGKPSKKMLFWKCLCFGMQVFVASGTWDKRVEQYGEIYAKKLDAQKTVRQTSSLHSLSTWIILYVWRYIDGQALLQVYCLVIFMDKVWEFLNFVQYLGFAVIIFINVISEFHLKHVRGYIGL